MMRYEISYEAATFSGSMFFVAFSEEEALRKFAEGFEEGGDPVPSHWISARWVIG